MLRSTALLGMLFATAFVPALAEEQAGFTMSLFDGKSLDGWIVSNCQAKVEDGALVLERGEGLVRSAQKYGDFVLELDWKARKASDYDAGIYLRADLPPEGKPWPTRYQVNLKQGQEGNLVGVPSATSSGLVKGGEWNHFKITVVGDTASLEINGKPAWKHAGLENKEGFIGFQSETTQGGQFEFRNVAVTELGYKPLFNGKDLTGWQGATGGYSVENGVLVCRKEGGGNLYTDREYRDFHFRFEFKLEPNGNNGVGIRAPLGGDSAYQGMEIQILDDYGDAYRDIKPYQFHGSVYGIVPAKRGHLHKAGQWNCQEIIARGRQVTVNLNGATIVDADLDKASTPQTIDGNAHPGLKNEKGHIGFLGHGARVEFRNVRLLDLSK
jgi:hypothetical protein